MPNMKSIISSHNKLVFLKATTPTQQPDTCNKRKKPDCLLEGTRLRQMSPIKPQWQPRKKQTYVGLATNFSERYTTIRHPALQLQDAKKPFQINWRVLKNISKNIIIVCTTNSSSFVKKSCVALTDEITERVQASQKPISGYFRNLE